MPKLTKPVPSTVLIKQDVRSANAIERNRTNQRAKLRNYQTIEAVAQEKQVLATRTQEYRKRRSEESTINSGKAGRQAVFSAVGKPSSDSNPILLILFTMFGLIIFYTLVTNPAPSSKFFGSLGDWLSLISTSTPIFQKKVP